MMRLGRFFQIAALILLAAGAQPALSAFWQWSPTAGNNATVDPTINWQEGMAPSAVNDSARAMMAALAKARNDTTTSNITTGGTSTAYTFSSNQGFDTIAHATNQIFLVYFHTANGANPTMSVDGLGQFPIFYDSGVAVPVGALKAGAGYFVGFYGVQWNIIGLVDNTYNLPLGAYLYTSVTSAPNANFVAANGGCITRTTYAAYFALVSTTYGACDGVSTFGVPDMRGRVAAMLDGGAGRLTNAANGCGTAFNTLGVACGNESETLTLAQLPSGINSTVTVTTATNNVGVIPISSGAVSSLQTQGAATTNITPNNSGGSWSGSTSLAGSGSGSAASNNTSGTAHPIVQPTYGVNVFVRVI